MVALYFLFWGVIFTACNIIYSMAFIYIFRMPLRKWPRLIYFKTLLTSLLTLLTAFDLSILQVDQWALSGVINISKMDAIVNSFTQKVLQNKKIQQEVAKNNSLGIPASVTLNSLNQRGLLQLPPRIIIERAKIQLGLIEGSQSPELCISFMKKMPLPPEEILDALNTRPPDEILRFFEINYEATLAALNIPKPLSDLSGLIIKGGIPLPAIEKVWPFADSLRLRLMLYFPENISISEKCTLYKKLLATIPELDETQALQLAQFLN